MNKKAGLPEIAFMITVLLFAGFVVLIGFKITSEFNDNIQLNADIDANGKTASQTLTGTYSGVIDKSLLFLTVGMGLGILILAALVRVHPIFIPFFWIGLLVLIFVAGYASNMYEEMALNPELVAQANQLTFIGLILGRLPIFIGVFGHLLLFVMYKVWRTDQ